MSAICVRTAIWTREGYPPHPFSHRAVWRPLWRRRGKRVALSAGALRPHALQEGNRPYFLPSVTSAYLGRRKCGDGHDGWPHLRHPTAVSPLVPYRSVCPSAPSRVVCPVVPWARMEATLVAARCTRRRDVFQLSSACSCVAQLRVQIRGFFSWTSGWCVGHPRPAVIALHTSHASKLRAPRWARTPRVPLPPRSKRPPRLPRQLQPAKLAHNHIPNTTPDPTPNHPTTQPSNPPTQHPNIRPNTLVFLGFSAKLKTKN